jgi:hypothetical protein
MAKKRLEKGIDFYYNDDGLIVFTEKYLLERGFCCNNNCKHCPYIKADKVRKKR